MRNAEDDASQLDGVTALVEDWHAKVSFLGVRTCFHLAIFMACGYAISLLLS